jgi:hypothetical protein
MNTSVSFPNGTRVRLKKDVGPVKKGAFGIVIRFATWHRMFTYSLFAVSVRFQGVDMPIRVDPDLLTERL